MQIAPFFIYLTHNNLLYKNRILKVFSSIHSYTSTKNTVVTLGTFDGVHVGHKCILNKIIESAKTLQAESLVLTFFPHPRMVLKQNDDIKLINTIEEKTELLQNLGIDNLVIHPFDNTFSQLSGEEFVKQVLVDIFKVTKIIIGYDHRFGKGGSCDINDLMQFGKKYGFEVEQISVQEINEVSVSSTKVRNALNKGDIKQANSFLGYSYFLSGKVVKGKQLGRTIGFPTANIQPNANYKLIPKTGVYVVLVEVMQKTYNGMLNIGYNPTVGGTQQTIEVNILDFDQDIYDQDIRVFFKDKIRDEVKFDSFNDLKIQLENDKNATISYFKS